MSSKVRQRSRSGAGRPGGCGLSEAEFALRFEEALPVFRSIAGGVLGSPAHVDDVVQEAAVIALRKLDSFEPESCFEAWMGQIVRFVALNAGRRRARRAERDVQIEHLDTLAESSPRREPPRFDHAGTFDADDSPFDDQVLRALNSLEETARVCLLLRTLHDMPYRRLSQILDIPEGTAMSHVHRARKTMRAILGGETEPIDA